MPLAPVSTDENQQDRNFLSRLPVENCDGFIGREDMLVWLDSNLRAKKPQHCAIEGEPRIGRTSLLRQIATRQLGVSESQRALYVWIGVADIPRRTSADFWQCLLEQLAVAQRLKGSHANLIRSKGNARALYNQLVSTLLELLRLRKYERIIFLIDDAELLVPGLRIDDCNWLRSLATDERFASHIAFVVTSTVNIKSHFQKHFERMVTFASDVIAIQKSISDLTNVFEIRGLSLLSEEGTEHMIRKAQEVAGEVSLQHADIDFLRREVGRHPDLLKVGCEYLFEAKRLLHTPAESLRLYDDIRGDIRYDSHVEWLCERLFERLDQQQKEIVRALARGETNNLDRIALRVLIRRLGLVEERVENGNPQLTLFADAFKHWVERFDSETQEKPSQLASARLSLQYLPESQTVRVNGEEILLTQQENRIMGYLYVKAGEVCRKEELLQEVWEAGANIESVDKAMNRLKAKIEPDPKKPQYIISIRGQGYLLRI